MDDETLRQALIGARNIAVVGLSDRPSRPSYGVARYLKEQGYRIIPVNPNITEVLGEKAYPDLTSVPDAIDLVDIFRRSSQVGPVVDEAISKGVQTIWMQLGIVDEAAAARARAAGITVIMNRCTLIEHRRLVGEQRSR
ncbi:MAG TPA: CoA-binding protein [Herpetosiphonaceae bacterium]|nr:CoA-binding protein [Herpetosiphonaceae bacterium]